MNKKTIWGVVGVVAIIVILVALSGAQTNNVTDKSPIKIGAVLSLTGDAAPWGEAAKSGIDLAVKTINSKGGINNRLVEVVYGDDHTSGKDAVSAYNKLVNVDKVSGVIGSVFDFTTQPLLPLAEANKNALISPSNFRIAGSFDTGTSSFVMLINFNDLIRYFREYMGLESVNKTAIVHFTSSWGSEITKTMNEIMTSYGKSKPMEVAYAQIGNNDFKTTVTKLKKEGIDTVFLDMLGGDTVNFLKRSKELGFAPKFITYMGSLEAFNQEEDKSLIENVVLVNWEISSKNFIDMYKREYGSAPAKSADKAFDALYVMATAAANTKSSSEVASYMSANVFTTPNAQVSFMPDHTVANTPVELQVVKNGALVPWVK